MTDIKMLPLPDIERYEVVGDIAYPINSDPNGDYVEYDGHVSAMADYARAVAEHNVASRDAEIEALRAEVERQKQWLSFWRSFASRQATLAEQAEARAERLAEALRLIAAPKRQDGTWNRDREACRQIAAEALHNHNKENDNG